MFRPAEQSQAVGDGEEGWQTKTFGYFLERDESGGYERQVQWVPVTDSSCSTEVKPVEREEAPQDDATEQPHEWKWMDKILKTLDKLSESPWTPDAWVREVKIRTHGLGRKIATAIIHGGRCVWNRR